MDGTAAVVRPPSCCCANALAAISPNSIPATVLRITASLSGEAHSIHMAD